MPQKSSIARLPTQIREQLERMIREGTYTIDEMVAEIRGMGGDVKRTAVGDFKQRMEERLTRVREAQEVGRVWVEKLGENPDSPMGQLVAEVLKTVAFRTITDLDASNETVKPMDLMLLSRALKEISGAQKVDHEHRRKLRDEFLTEMKAKATAAAGVAEKEARAAGLTDDAVALMRKHVLGVVG
ncbi:MAG: DUF3486 family protein [Gemmatimonadaceae bacterium]